jgi:uncharacterized membrane protein SpoIIM required for sporulation
LEFPAEAGLRQHLEILIARAYAEIHETRSGAWPVSLRRWFWQTFPQTIRRHHVWLLGSFLIMLTGALFGAVTLMVEPSAKATLLPFEHLQHSPTERVRAEESQQHDRIAGQAGTFSAMLMTNNIKVSILTLALGMTFGLGTIIMLFYNGVILGVVAWDYILDGQARFLAGWLLPHGSIEIPAILIAGQAGLILGRALIGWNCAIDVKARLRQIAPDLATLVGGVALLLVWAGLIEAFFSQYHEPVLPYALKIAFGLAEMTLLGLFLHQSGRTGNLRQRWQAFRRGAATRLQQESTSRRRE